MCDRMEIDEKLKNKIEQWMQPLLLAKRKRLDLQPSHECSGGQCNPDNFSAVLRKGMLPPSYRYALASDVNEDLYLCDYGGIHYCAEGYCRFTEICEISGRRIGYGMSHYEKGSSTKVDKWARDITGPNHIGQNIRVAWVPSSSKNGVSRKPEKPQSRLEKLKAAAASSKADHGDATDTKPPRDGSYRVVWIDQDIEKRKRARGDAAATDRPQKKRKRKTNAPSTSNMREKVTSLIKRLFYNTEYRQQINKDREEKQQQEFSKLTKRYEDTCERLGQLECLGVIKIYYLNTIAQAKVLPLLACDSEKLEQCVDMVMHIWEIVVRYGKSGNRNAGPIICLQLTLFTLYGVMLANGLGMRINGTRVDLIDHSEYVEQALPPWRVLHYYQEADGRRYRRAFTQGKKVLEEALQAARKNGVNLADLHFKHSKATNRNSRLREDYVALG